MIIKDNMLDIINQTWPTILICSVILVLTRLSYIFMNKKPLIVYRELFALACIVYMMCLFHVVTFKDDSLLITKPNYIPFREILRYINRPNLFIKNIVGNTVMFIPFGFFISYYVRSKKPYFIFFISLITSTTIEITQQYIDRRVFDIDDIFLNVLGALVGYYIFRIMHKIQKRLPRFLRNNVVYNFLIISFIVVLFLFLFKW